MATRDYDLKKVVMTINGLPVEGAADGDKLTIAFDEDAFSLGTGADGENTRSKSNNTTATATLSLQYGQPANQLLQAQYDLDRLTGQGAFDFGVIDALASSSFSGRFWVQKAPDVPFGMEAGTVEWVIRTGELSYQMGVLPLV